MAETNNRLGELRNGDAVRFTLGIHFAAEAFELLFVPFVFRLIPSRYDSRLMLAMFIRELFFIVHPTCKQIRPPCR